MFESVARVLTVECPIKALIMTYNVSDKNEFKLDYLYLLIIYFPSNEFALI